jgi:hypothetical protein
VLARNAALIEDEALKGYYIDYLKHMMSLSRSYQHRIQSGLKVAYSGVEGAFGHIAAGRIFPESDRISCIDFKAAYESVVAGESDVAVLPIENSYAGEVGQVMDLIFSGSLFINGIYELACIILVFPLIVWFGASGKPTGRFSMTVCKFLGDISYPLYIVHYPVMYLFYSWLIDNELYTLGETWQMVLLVMATNIALAYICLKLYDEPVRKWLANNKNSKA